MGSTLTHGVYLPDEGERNCYNGLASNWSILDGAVGTIAEHTTALSGKAPLSHTHTKSDITDFPALANVATSGSYNDLSNIPASFTPASHSHGNITNDGKVGTTANVPLITGTDGVIQAGSFGTAANTFCEGNDSRLSDARTPVAHTHTKSDVTDLLNSSFIPSANNSYDLGSSSYQWNNLYAKNYYYNGTAWGLDKANVWTKTQNFVGEYQGTELSSNYNTCFGMYGVKDTVGKSGMFFTKYRPNKAQGSLTASDIIQYGVDALENEVRTTNVFDLQVGKYDSNTGKFTKIDVISTLPNANLGTSNNKWTTLNGINPGALSIFNPSATQDPIDVPNTWATDGSAWNTLNVSNMGDGWICLTYRLCGANDYILARFGGASASTCPSMIFPATLLQDSKYYIYTLMPVTKAMGNIYLEINLDSNAVLVKHSFIPAYGTV